MRALAEANGEIFLPNPEPQGPVDYVLICMEPSLGRWANSAAEARSKVNRGFRNFVSSFEDFILHFCARRYLCLPGQRYHVTDLAKGAMLVSEARATRDERYERWFPLLEEELNLIARRDAGIIAVGTRVAEELERRRLSRPFIRVIHYSGQAARARKAAIAGQEAKFEAFKSTVTLEDVLNEAESVLVQAQLSPEYRARTLARLARKNLTESRLQLMFHYMTTFESMRRRQAGRDPVHPAPTLPLRGD
jgi:hypothetical protein